MGWREALQDSVEAVTEDEVPDLIGELARLVALAQVRLQRPSERPSKDGPGRWLTAAQVAEKLQVDCKWVYSHKADLGGVSLSRRKLRFSLSEVERYLRRRKAASSGRRK